MNHTHPRDLLGVWAALSLPWFEELGSRKTPQPMAPGLFLLWPEPKEKLRMGGQHGVCELEPYHSGKAGTRRSHPEFRVVPSSGSSCFCLCPERHLLTTVATQG